MTQVRPQGLAGFSMQPYSHTMRLFHGDGFSQITGLIHI
jgi:hypothetical protein